MTLSTQLRKLPKSTSKKQNIYNILLINMTQSVKLNRDIHFTCILRLLNNTCVKHNFKSVHVSNLFWSREYNSAKEICKYASFSKVGGNYPLDLKIIWSSGYINGLYSSIGEIDSTVKPVYKGHLREHENDAFVRSCPLLGWKFSVFWLISVFLAKVQTVLEIRVNLMSFFFRGWGMHFWQRN
jgi:hypothetical protein